jgi:hypothetical protein
MNTRTPSDAASLNISSAYPKTHTPRQRPAAFTEGVAYSQPERAAAPGADRPCSAGVAGARCSASSWLLLLAYTAADLLNDMGHVRMPAARTRNDHRGSYASAVGWPQPEQTALVLGDGRPAATPGEQPVSIVGLAKVMTAYLALQRYPLSAQAGFPITITAAQTDAAAFFPHVTVAGRGPTAVGAVMGQRRVATRRRSPSPPGRPPRNWSSPSRRRSP